MRFTKLAFLCVMLAGTALAVNTWNISVEANVDQIPNFSRQFARGETWYIQPLITDDGVPRVWNTNTSFVFFWQKQNGQTNWWASTNVTFPVYHNVTIKTLAPVVTSYISNTTFVVYTPAMLVFSNSYTNYVYYGPTTNTISTTNHYTSYVSGYTTTNIVDTGRVSAVWQYDMDIGVNSYNWFIGAFEGTNRSIPSYRVNGTITMLGSPGVGGSFIGNPMSWPWATTNFVTNLFGQVTSYAVWVTTNGAPAGYYNLISPR